MWERIAAQNTETVCFQKALCRKCGNELNCSSAETSPFRSSIHHPDRVSLKYVEIFSVADPWNVGVDPEPNPRIHAAD